MIGKLDRSNHVIGSRHDDPQAGLFHEAAVKHGVRALIHRGVPRAPTRHTRRVSTAAGVLLFLVCLSGAARPADGVAATKVTSELRERAVDVLRQAVRTQQRWKKVHAAEALVSLDYDVARVRAEFATELDRDGDTPEYRIGIRRVLIRAAADPEARRRWIEDIRQAFLDPTGPDRLHAAETLGKLGYVMRPKGDEAFEKAAFADASRLAAYAAWVVANSASEKGVQRLTALLGAPEAGVRAAAAYALRHRARVGPEALRNIVAALGREARDSPARIHLAAAAYCLAGPQGRDAFKAEIIDAARSGDDGQRYQACLVLAEYGVPADLPLLTQLLDSPGPDTRIGAATAILRIERRTPRSLARLDWAVIVLYAAGMLLVGWYYARRTKTQEDYLLGGRSMKPWAVGLSLFATLLSTISYLAVPGEMIKHGPMIIAQVAVLPLIVIVVGWFLIPYFMRLKITTAYEVLETRFGVSVRVLASVFFLSLRLLWMAVIIYATTSKILIPLLGWSEAATPYVCAALGLITVVYTSMGGLRAVVFTDVVQTFILFGGAVLAVLLITGRLGGVAAWWPTHWAPTWDKPVFWFDAKARVTFASACLSAFVWYVCTAGSDQMAIQRYLATRDARAARRMFTTSMTANALVMIFLAVLGCALLAYFQAFPQLVPDGQTIASSADRLFTRFIVSGLPPGISGLIIAGLLAAAMSSLSSGVNSAGSVVAVDFVERFRRTGSGATDSARVARTVSWVVGVIVVLLSSTVGFVSGNLLEVTYKLVNLLVTPLFILFFMALFVPWATGAGTWLAAAVSTTVAIGIAFFHWFGLSFLWIMPLSLLAGAVVGPTASLVLGTRSPGGRRQA